MTTRNESPKEDGPTVESLQATIAEKDAAIAEQGDTIATLNDMVSTYQQLHAEAVYASTMLSSKLKTANGRLAAAGPAA